MKFRSFSHISIFHFILSLSLAFFAACSKNSGSAPAPVVVPAQQNSPVFDSQPKEGHFSVREVLSGRSTAARDLGTYVSAQGDSAIFCKLVDAPNSVFGKFITIEAMWDYQNSALNEYFRVRIASQSPRDILPGANSYDFVDANVQLYHSKTAPVNLANFNAIEPESYSCDITNLVSQDQKLSGRIQCYKDNLYHGYSMRINFACTLE